jgi:chromosome partitioning protein
MPIILGVVSQKGGVGKSSVTRMIAREFAHNGWDVKIADMDIQQGTSFHWSKTRAAHNLEPAIRTETFSSVALALKDAPHFDLFIFDGAPAASAATRDIARAADLVLLPSGLCTDDMRPQVLLAHELTKAGVPAGKLCFVLCRVGDSETEIQEARDYITGAGYKVLGGALPERALYRRASDAGRSFTESRHRGLNERADIVVQNIAEAIKELTNQKSEVA